MSKKIFFFFKWATWSDKKLTSDLPEVPEQMQEPGRDLGFVRPPDTQGTSLFTKLFFLDSLSALFYITSY